MTKGRLEAFSDGVIAIIITIMVLELKVPHEASWHALYELRHVFISYVLSFVFVGIYWGNHHHLLHTIHHVTSKIIWSNMVLLFFLSLIPFSTAWVGENHFENIPVTFYAINMLFCAIAFYFLQSSIMSAHTHSTKLIEALKKQEKKGFLSLFLYISAIPSAYYLPWLAAVIFVFTAIIWLIPDKRIEAALKEHY